MSESNTELGSITVPADQAIVDGVLVVPEAPEGFVGEMKIIIHAEVIGVDGKVRTTTHQQEDQ